jgi:hypothetical protein
MTCNKSVSFYYPFFLHDIYSFAFPGGRSFGKMWLFFGCRQRALDLYREEKATMLKEGVLDKVYLALSREPTIPKVTKVVKKRVQDFFFRLVVSHSQTQLF